MKKFSEIKKELKSKGIEVRRIRATLNARDDYIRSIHAQQKPARNLR